MLHASHVVSSLPVPPYRTRQIESHDPSALTPDPGFMRFSLYAGVVHVYSLCTVYTTYSALTDYFALTALMNSL